MTPKELNVHNRIAATLNWHTDEIEFKAETIAAIKVVVTPGRISTTAIIDKIVGDNLTTVARAYEVVANGQTSWHASLVFKSREDIQDFWQAHVQHNPMFIQEMK